MMLFNKHFVGHDIWQTTSYYAIVYNKKFAAAFNFPSN
jgi:hypothetical protein